jgi:hypothetical protein
MLPDDATPLEVYGTTAIAFALNTAPIQTESLNGSGNRRGLLRGSLPPVLNQLSNDG